MTILNKVLFLLILIFSTNSLAQTAITEATVYGPQKFEVINQGKKKSDTKPSSATFSVSPNTSTTYEIQISNGADMSGCIKPCRGNRLQKLSCEIRNLFARFLMNRSHVDEAIIKLNGQIIVNSKNLKKTDSLVLAIQPQANNRLDVDLEGPTHSFITIEVVAVQSNQPPTVRVASNISTGIAPLLVQFDGSASTDDGTIVSYDWNFGDGNTGQGKITSHTFSSSGNYEVTLTVTDNLGLTASAPIIITVIANQIPVANFEADPASGIAPLLVQFNGSLSSDADGVISNYSWDFGDGQTANGVTASHKYTIYGDYTVKLTVTDDRGASNTAQMIINIKQDQPPVANIVANKNSGFVPLMVLFDGSNSTDPDGTIASYIWDFGDGTTSTTAMAPHQFNNAGNFTVTLTVTDNLGATGQAQVSINVKPIPQFPDPVDFAPPLNNTQSNSMGDSLAFLYSGTVPIQTGVIPGTIDEKRVSLVKGRVLDKNNQPIEGVKVSAIDLTELGQTFTRADGNYDFVFNGGGYINLKFERNGYFTVHRQISSQFNQYYNVNDVVMTAPDPKATLVQLNSANLQVAQGSTITDQSGTRTSTVLIPPQTTANLRMPNGSTQPISQLTLRMTEYTVGENGPNAMPAELPGASAYTYAFDLNADEAIALGAEHIEFSKPVPIYVDNFLGFDVGSSVPAGVYDAKAINWVAQNDGRVIQIQSITNGQAVLVVNTNNTPATTAELNTLGITTAELQTLATLYQPGQSFWRATTTQFSPWDFNWYRRGMVSDPIPNPLQPFNNASVPRCENKAQGSIINIESQGLGESVDLVGTPFSLNYFTKNMPGKLSDNTLNIWLTPNTIEPTLTNVNLTVIIAGQVFKKSFTPATNLLYSYTWDGKDGFGRSVTSAQIAQIKIEYEYFNNYMQVRTPTNPNVRSFANVGADLYVSGIQARNFVAYQRTFYANVGNAKVTKEQSLAGWDINIHHVYDPFTKTVMLGTGDEQTFSDNRKIISWAAGSIVSGFSGDGGPAVDARFQGPVVSVASDGSQYIADTVNGRIRRVNPNGIVNTVAGTGIRSLGADGPALQANIDPRDIAVGPGDIIYFSDGSRIRKIENGNIVTVAGGGGGAPLSGSLATSISFNNFIISSFAVAKDKTIYISSRSFGIGKVTPDGRYYFLGGNGSDTNDGAIISKARITDPNSLSIDNNDNLMIVELLNNTIRRVDKLGVVKRIAGAPFNGTNQVDGIIATDAYTFQPTCAFSGYDGSVYICFPYNIRAIRPDGKIYTIAGNGGDSLDTVTNVPPTKASLKVANSAALAPNGDLYIGDFSKVHRIVGVVQSPTTDPINIASKDNSELYIFDKNGRHLETKYSKTGNTKYLFGYDSNGRLVSITDAFNNVTQIQRDNSGAPFKIISPYNQVTQLGTDNNGYLNLITNPNNETHTMTYTPNGLLTSFKNPRNATSNFSYNALGELMRDDNAVGGFTELEREILSTGYVVNKNTAEQRFSQIGYQQNSNGDIISTYQDPQGLFSSTTFTNDNKAERNEPNGNNIQTQEYPDPRLGQYSRFQNLLSITTPSSLNYNAAITRSVVRTNAGLFDFIQTDTLNLNNNTYVTTYDSSTKTTTVKSPLNRIITSVTDEQERPASIQVTGLTSVSYAYDNRGRIENITQGNRITSFVYNSTGNLDTITDPLNRSTSYIYDNSNRVTKTTLSDGRTISYNYDSNGNLTSITPPGKPAHNFIYDLINQVTKYDPPLLNQQSMTTQYSYNLDKQLINITRPNGQIANFNYDDLQNNIHNGRLMSISTSAGNYSYSYFANGNIDTITSPDNVSCSYTYDGNLLKSETTSGASIGSVAYVYDRNFNVTSIKIGSATANTFAYNTDNLMTRAGTETINYNSANTLISGTVLGSSNDSYGYNNFGEVTSYTANQGTSLRFSMTLTRDDTGRITNKTENVLGTTNSYVYGYDLQGRLTSAQKNASTNTYIYDDNGNRTSAAVNGVTASATYDNQDRLLTYGNNNYTYDANGVLRTKVSAAGTTQYSYDTFDNLKSVTLPNGNLVSYIYDGNNRLVGKKVNGALTQMFVYDGQLRIVAELTGAGVIRSQFIYGTKSNVPDYMIQGTQSFKIVSDQLGSVRLVLNSGGTTVQQVEYDEFGRVLSDSNPGLQPFGFAGGLAGSDIGMVKFGARWYDPETGRWLSKDPILFNGGSTNLYSYAVQDPINFIDPSGLAVCYYSVSSHTMTCTGSRGTGYRSSDFTSGAGGVGRNNPYYSDIPNAGPIPSGTYDIDPTKRGSDSPSNPLGRRPLNPSSPNGRSDMQIHGCSDPNTCSTGCIGATSNNARNELANFLYNEPAGTPNVLIVGP